MAILEEEILVNLNGTTVKYYENLGYEIPRYIDMQNRYVFQKGTKIKVRVSDLKENSEVIVTKICDDCGEHIPNLKYKDIMISRKEGDGIDRCLKCSLINAGEKRKNNTPYKKSLEYYAKNNRKEYLLKEYSYKNNRKPDNVAYMSNEEFLWECPNCKSEYPMVMHNRTNNNQQCPYCNGRRVNHTNCLWTTHPDIANSLVISKRGYEITAGSNKKEVFKCRVCGYKQSKVVQSVVRQGLACPMCSDNLSFPEKFMRSILFQLELEFEPQKTFDWSENKRYDFYIKQLNTIIEVHGGQHYNGNFKSLKGRSLEEEQKNDELKERLAKNNGINYIIINCSKSEPEFIKKNIIESDLLKIADLSIIDWNKCQEYACNTLVKTVSELWSTFQNTTEIGRIVNLAGGTVCQYLKQGNKLGWCDYNPSKVKRNLGKKVVQLSVENDEYIKTWNMIAEAGDELGLCKSNITAACKGKYSHAGGFKWMYLEDYEKQMNLIAK